MFSHPSKIDLIETARARGYLVVVMHVGVDSPDLSVARVRLRTEEGGHDVPEGKVRARYERGASLVREAVSSGLTGSWPSTARSLTRHPDRCWSSRPDA